MGKKINDGSEFPAVTPADNDRVLGIDVSDTSTDPNGKVVTFQVSDLFSVSEADVVAHQDALQITESQITDLGSYITDLVNDTTPQLGGDLDVNGNKIVSTSNGNIDIEPNGTGDVLLGNFRFDADQTIGAGQDDFVLTYDNTTGKISLEEAGGGGGGLVPISKTTASNDAAIDIVLTGGYSAYLVRFEDVKTANDAAIPVARTSTDGGTTFDTGSADYDYTLFRIEGSTAQTDGTGSPYILLGQSHGNDTGETFFGEMRVYVGGTGYPAIMSDIAYTNSTSFPGRSVGAGHRLSTTAIDAIRVYMLSGNITSGDFHLYGIADGA